MSMRSQQNELVSLHYVVHGDGPPVVLLHGIAASLYDWKYLLPQLTQAGFQGYAPDLWGHGQSTKPDTPEVYDFNAIYTHMLSWIDDLNFNQPLFLIGHSLGGLLSLKYVFNRPENVQGMVLINPF